MITEWHLLDTGFCSVPRPFSYGDGRGTAICHALCALLRHEKHGWLLFDAGYAPRVNQAVSTFPYNLYRIATPFKVREEDAAVNQLSRFGVSVGEIKHVIVSHFHADHIGGLRDFPNSRIVCTRSAYDTVANLSGFSAVRRAFLPALVPDDFAERAVWVETLPLADPIPELPTTRDLFGDGSCLVMPLPGHAAGQIGLLARTSRNQSVFLVADAAYTERAIRENVPFHPITNFFTDDPAAANETRFALHNYHRAFPETWLIPTHCPEAYKLCSP